MNKIGCIQTVIEQDDRIVEDRGLKVIPLGGEEKTRGESIQ